MCCYCNDGSPVPPFPRGGGEGGSEMFNKNIILLNYVFLLNKQQNKCLDSIYYINTIQSNTQLIVTLFTHYIPL